MQFTKPSYNWTPGGLVDLLKKGLVFEPREITRQLGFIFGGFWEVTPVSNMVGMSGITLAWCKFNAPPALLEI